MVGSIIKSLKKSWRLKKISKELSGHTNPKDISQLLLQQNDRHRAFDELIALCKADENVRHVIDKYAVDDEKLKALYQKLSIVGAGQYASGHYVAASSLCYAWTLKFLLDHFDGEKLFINGWDDYNSSLFISDRLIKYFGKGEAGEINY